MSDSLKDFLVKNRPVPGEPPKGESQAIWARIAATSENHFPTRPLLWKFVAAAAVVLVVFALSLRTLDRSSEALTNEELTDEEVLSDSLLLSFLEDDVSDELFSFNDVAD